MRIRILTFKTPNNQRVGSTPTENIKRNMIEAMRVIMLDGVAMVMTRARDANIQVQTSPESRGSNSEMKENVHLVNPLYTNGFFLLV